MMGWYPPLNELSDSTWHMFTHVVESNQHSLHDIYVHGGLYPTHACTRCEHDRTMCIIIRVHVHWTKLESASIQLKREDK